MAMSDKMATAKSVISTVGSVAAAAMVARSLINEFLPHEVHDYLFSAVRSFFSRRFTSEITMIIDEFDGLENNQIFEAATLYLGNRTRSSLSTTSASWAHRLKVSKHESEKTIQVNVDRGEEIIDEFEGVKFRWVLQCHHVEAKNLYNPRDMNSTLRSEVRSFCLTFHRKNNNKAIQDYLPYILNQAVLEKQEIKTVKLYTVDFQNMYGSPTGAWTPVNLNHPAKFETLAMDSELKRLIMEDLDRFVRRKEYYRNVGKAWKRGYLLYGLPGTGKSSLIAAMANHLNFDVYDLELAGVGCDSDLRKLLIGTANKSILVVEDIDCAVEFKDRQADDPAVVGSHHERRPQITLSGLLNFMDGLWSSCGDERIIVFTTNHKDKLDQALLRPGRMDMHIHMSYCTPCGFKILANNYLGLKHHALFDEVERLVEVAGATPAEVAEQLMKHDKPDPALASLIEFLKSKKLEKAQAEAKESKSNNGEPKGLPEIKDAQGVTTEVESQNEQ